MNKTLLFVWSNKCLYMLLTPEYTLFTLAVCGDSNSEANARRVDKATELVNQQCWTSCIFLTRAYAVCWKITQNN